MAEVKKRKLTDEVVAQDPHDNTTIQAFPAKPSTWDYIKESFQPTAVRADLDAVRKRREQSK